VITIHQRHRQTDRQTDAKRSHDRYIAKACSGKKERDISSKTLSPLETTVLGGLITYIND